MTLGLIKAVDTSICKELAKENNRCNCYGCARIVLI